MEPFSTRIDSVPGGGLNITLLNVAFSQMIDREVIPSFATRVVELLAEELVDEARAHLLGAEDAKSALLNEVLNKVSDKIYRKLFEADGLRNSS